MPEHIIFFDGLCHLCSRSVQTVLRHDKRNLFYFAALQGSTATEMLGPAGLRDADSIVLYESGKFYYMSTAVLRIAGKLRFPVCLLSVMRIVPACIRDAVYRRVAAGRYALFGKRAACWLPETKYLTRFLA